MPGWILVANRFSLLPIVRKYGLLSAIASTDLFGGCVWLFKYAPAVAGFTATDFAERGRDCNGNQSSEAPDSPLLTESSSTELAAAAKSSIEKTDRTIDKAAFENTILLRANLNKASQFKTFCHLKMISNHSNLVRDLWACRTRPKQRRSNLQDSRTKVHPRPQLPKLLTKVKSITAKHRKFAMPTRLLSATAAKRKSCQNSP